MRPRPSRPGRLERSNAGAGRRSPLGPSPAQYMPRTGRSRSALRKLDPLTVPRLGLVSAFRQQPVERMSLAMLRNGSLLDADADAAGGDDDRALRAGALDGLAQGSQLQAR